MYEILCSQSSPFELVSHHYASGVCPLDANIVNLEVDLMEGMAQRVDLFS